MKAIKQTIKQLANEQVSLKNQRKSINIVGERKLSQADAAYTHFKNRDTLRHLHAAYYFLRHGLKPQVNSKNPVNQDRVDKLVAQYYEPRVEKAA